MEDQQLVSKYGRDSYYFNPNVADPPSKTSRRGVEEIRCCPVCVDRGEPDSRETFSWNTTKLIGYCQRCSAKFSLFEDIPDFKMRMKTMSSVWSHNQSVVNRGIPLSKIDYENMFSDLSQDGLTYLEARNPFIGHMVSYLNIRERVGVGIAVPIVYDDILTSYQLRYYRPVEKMKYRIPVGEKLFYSPNNAFKKGAIVSKITICEGYFDAIALLLLGYPNPIAVQGSTLTELQGKMLSSKMVDSVICAMDNSYLSRKMRKSVLDNVSTVSKITSIDSSGDDPEEILFKRLDDGTLDLDKLVHNLNQILDGLPTTLIKI